MASSSEKYGIVHSLSSVTTNYGGSNSDENVVENGVQTTDEQDQSMFVDDPDHGDDTPSTSSGDDTIKRDESDLEDEDPDFLASNIHDRPESMNPSKNHNLVDLTEGMEQDDGPERHRALGPFPDVKRCVGTDSRLENEQEDQDIRELVHFSGDGPTCHNGRLKRANFERRPDIKEEEEEEEGSAGQNDLKFSASEDVQAPKRRRLWLQRRSRHQEHIEDNEDEDYDEDEDDPWTPGDRSASEELEAPVSRRNGLRKRQQKHCLSPSEKYDLIKELIMRGSDIEVLKKQVGLAEESNHQTAEGESNDRQELHTARQAPAKSAKEAWARYYANHKIDAFPGRKRDRKRDRTGPPSKRRPGKSQVKINGKHGALGPGASQLLDMLCESNSLLSRAAKGEIKLTAPRQNKTKQDQWREITRNIANNPNQGNYKSDKRNLRKAMGLFGYGNCKARNGLWLLPGMKTPLFHHQLVAVSWMLGREFHPNGPFGGLLADEMGLGKTLDVLATMACNRPTQQDMEAGRQTTLIVAPASAVHQWMEEVSRHCDWVKTMLIYKASMSQTVGKHTWQNVDIIITSYSEVARSYPSDQLLRKLAKLDLSEAEWDAKFDEACGRLFHREFFRVVLDEGHGIRNQVSLTSRSCLNLNSKYRWVVTGTPIFNYVDETFPYLKFIGSELTDGYGRFTKSFCKDVNQSTVEDIDEAKLKYFLQKEVSEAIATHLQSIMLRRLVDDDFLDAPILQIPQTHPIQMKWVELEKGEEASTYRRLEKFIQQRFRLAKSNGGGLRACVLMVNRLRQAVSHYFMLEKVMGDVDAILSDSMMQTTFDGEGCPVCGDIPLESRRTECGHLVCEECLEGLVERAQRLGTMGEVKCPTCGQILGNELEFVKYPPNEGEKQEYGNDYHGLQPKSAHSRRLGKCDRKWPAPVTLSSKTKAVRDLVLMWQREAPDDKIIKWRLTARIVGRMLTEYRVNYLYNFGGFSNNHRIQALETFKSDPKCKVLITSMKVGGVALNLTSANRVIVIDPWWNTALETQAFGRVHRIGQTKETYFVKILAENTYDRRLIEIQEEKSRMASEMLTITPTMRELHRLIGLIDDNDEQGKTGHIIDDDTE